MPSETQTISFRVPTHIAGRLEKAGAEVRLSKNEYARDLVVKALPELVTVRLPLSPVGRVPTLVNVERPFAGSEPRGWI